MRSCGVLMHITSLPSPYGIGTFGDEAEHFVDWLKSAGQSYWQVLPLTPTGFGDSPYQSFSAFAGNPLLIDLDDLAENGLITKESCDAADYGADPTFVDFEKVYRTKMRLLEEAYKSFSEDVGYLAFIQEEAFWLEDYALFMALKEQHDFNSWQTWESELRRRMPNAMEKAREDNCERAGFWKFIQYTFYRQWQRTKRYANKNGIKIIGDLPIYVSPDSSDVWANPDLFLLDADRRPTKVAGVPPDYFSKTGQLWGNPLYDWEKMKSEGYGWWITRVKKALEMYDYARIDHFRAFDTYYAIPADEKNAINGKWEIGPRMDLFNAIKAELGDCNIIAEDLGEIFDSVRELLKSTGFPGMRVMQFGFNPSNDDNDHLLFRYPPSCVAYTGTHDNSTVLGWAKSADGKAVRNAKRYLKPLLFEKLSSAFIRGLYSSAAGLAIVPMQDLLGLDDRARMNVPSTIGNNWIWRMKKGANSPKLAKKLNELSETYFRKEKLDKKS